MRRPPPLPPWLRALLAWAGTSDEAFRLGLITLLTLLALLILWRH